MSTVPPSKIPARASWYALHVMAVLSGALLIVGVVGVALALGNRSAVPGFFQSAASWLPTVAPLLGFGLVAAFWLLVAMARDYLAHRTARPRQWGVLLLVFNWGAAIAYFVLVWRPEHLRGGT